MWADNTVEPLLEKHPINRAEMTFKLKSEVWPLPCERAIYGKLVPKGEV